VKQYLLVDYFIQMFEDLGLCDLEPISLIPTWRNFRKGKDGISTRVYIFLVAEKIMEEMEKLKSWMGGGDI